MIRVLAITAACCAAHAAFATGVIASGLAPPMVAIAVVLGIVLSAARHRRTGCASSEEESVACRS